MGIGWKRLSGGAESFTGDVRGTHERIARIGEGSGAVRGGSPSAPFPPIKKGASTSDARAFTAPHTPAYPCSETAFPCRLRVVTAPTRWPRPWAKGDHQDRRLRPIAVISVSSRCSPAHACRPQRSTRRDWRVPPVHRRAGSSSGCRASAHPALPRQSATPPLFSGRPRFLRRCRLSPGNEAIARVPSWPAAPSRRSSSSCSPLVLPIACVARGECALARDLGRAALLNVSATSGRWASVDTFGRNRCKTQGFGATTSEEQSAIV